VDGEGLQTRVFQFGYPQDFGQLYRDELTRAGNVQLYLNANAVEIELHENGAQVVGLQLATLGGRRFQAVANAFVLAAGGIENPRLLLSSNRVEACGVGNRHDLVGRFFMDHPYFFTGYFEPSNAGYNNLHLVEDYGRVGREQSAVALFSLSQELLRREALNNCGVFFIRRPNYKILPAYNSPGGRSFLHLLEILKHTELPDGGLRGHLGGVLNDPRSVGKIVAVGIKERFRPRYRQALRAQLEPTPNPDSRVLLGRRKDRLGMNRVEVDWRLNPGDKRSLIRIHELLAEALESRDLGRLVVDLAEYDGAWPGSMSGGKHHMGTTRMHQDPRRGVVDPDGKVHGISNLYVAGSSVFPTAGYANPTLTLVALALRLADHLKVRLGI
jgi:choline dehydrogenase-like flavoprotein